MVVGVSEDEEISNVEAVLETVKALGKVRVRGKMFDPDSKTLTMLCECREAVDSTQVPPEVVHTTEEGVVWQLVIAEPEVNSQPFSEKLDKFLQEEGKTLEDLQRLYNPNPSLEPNPRVNHSCGSPTPPGEDNLDNWLEQAKFMSEEYEYSDKEKRRRIVESLKGPALEIIQAVRLSNSEATHIDYLQALESTFGTSESGEELYLKFRALHQTQDEWDVGLAKDVEHKIRLSDSTPFRERSRRLAPADIDDVRRHLQQLLEAGILKESRSPYASPIVVVRKKNGSIRICIDYRTLNSRTIPDQYTIPRIDDALDCLTGSKWFSVLDLRSGYYQIAMSEEDKEKTAFICPLGFYQFEECLKV
ncbi:hypothetical protein WMY93_001161 [Mugilogobius chulae]|uniref:ribonuclease H n=1 Tax=Mugilogobius chulae TaxID=88201 RepID=A0AAW0Q312_9GOBI